MFKISEFSRIAHINVRLLRHYDNIGLLKPTYIDPQTGYRYYSAEQLPTVNRILVLKDLGFSLAQVKRMVDDNISASEIREMLIMRKAQIEQALEKELTRLDQVEMRLHQIENDEQLRDFEVVIKEMAAQEVFSMRTTVSSLEEGWGIFGKAQPIVQQQKNLGALLVIIHNDVYDDNLDLEIGFFIERGSIPRLAIPQSDLYLECHQLPPVPKMATTTYIGVPSGTLTTYAALSKWVQNGNYVIAGAWREVYLQRTTAAESSEMVMELQLPIEKALTSPPI